jgi:hypothetical protein
MSGGGIAVERREILYALHSSSRMTFKISRYHSK